MFYSNVTTWINPASALEGRLLIPIVLPLMLMVARGLKHARRWLPLVVLALILSGCDPYRLPDGGYAFDVHIRIAPPAAIPTIAPSPTPLPTFTPTRTPTVVPAATNTQPAATVTPEPTPSRESTVIFNTPQPIRYVTNTTNSAWRVRSAPVDGLHLEWMLPGQQLEFDGVLEESGWLQVKRVGGGTGFVHPNCCIDRG
jgi:hypothetical protein